MHVYSMCIYEYIYIYMHTHIYIYTCVCVSWKLWLHLNLMSIRIDCLPERPSILQGVAVLLPRVIQWTRFGVQKKKPSSGHITSFCRDAIRMFVKNSGLILAVPMIQIVIHPEFCWVPPPTCGLDQHFTADRFRSQLCGHCTFAVLVFFVSYFGIDIAL
jgi:hypothetical protein